YQVLSTRYIAMIRQITRLHGPRVRCYARPISIRSSVLPISGTMQGLYEKIEAATAFIRKAWQGTPHAGIILGTGLGSLVKHIQEEASLEYEEIPHFPRSTATSHRGR